MSGVTTSWAGLLPAGAGHRADIDGLRALAVLGVILNHAGLAALPGGFVGVDVFFALSGYLITAILIRELAAGRFSLRRFYARRFRRILPALFVVLAATSATAWVVMTPSDLHDYGLSLLATLLFVANLYFLDITGYFSPDVGFLPLLHMWSLAVEEQFYLLFPLLLLAAWRIARIPGAVALVAGLTVLSAAVALWGIAHEPEKVYFFSPARFWQILLGAAAALWVARRPVRASGALSGLGLAMILAGFVLYDHATPFPGPAALLPVAGTVLVLIFGGAGSGLAGRILSWPPLRLLGLISFSAYLWHQPVFAFARLQDLGPEGSPARALVLIALVLALSFASWLWVEEPFRRGAHLSAPRRAAVIAGFAALIGVAVLSRQPDLVLARHAAADLPLVSVLREDAIRYQRKGDYGREDRAFDPAGGRVKIALVGDSFARDLLNVLDHAGVRAQADISLHVISSVCTPLYLPQRPPEVAARQQSRHCGDYDIYTSEALKDRLRAADQIWLASSWQPQDAALIVPAIAALLRDFDRPMVVFGTKHFGHVPQARLLRMTPAERLALRAPVPPALAALNAAMAADLAPLAAAGRLRFVDLLAQLCTPLPGGGTGCPQVDPEGWWLSPDGTHLTPRGAAWVAAALGGPAGLAALLRPGG